ncbi:FecR family protein [Chitinophaga sp. 22321]|uniref:FecR family protein n=1 Tax=Chitinophaga hostae TaxID=2831022 RepID=A0ABS5IUB9_9BACT|nr:FecR family protein [Chitinophaga hostae]MBS0026505.1 FecR family protein [Chitinophaga hostae]
MQITKQQIQQFLDAACTGEEASAIAAYLKNNPEILNSYLQEEWNASTDEGRLTPAEGKMMYQEILQQLPIKKTPVFTLKKTRWVAAAVVLFLAGITALSTKKQHTAKMAQALPVQPDSAHTEQEWKVYLNATGQKKKITLQDSTIVVLSAKSQISCKQPFPANKREIKMKGQVYFDVHKNQSKPFTVYAGNTVTTALGTSFCINMCEKEVTIKLFTGKVMIKPVHGSARGWDSTIFLLPGEQMQYHISKDNIAISAFNKKAPDHTPLHSTILSFNNEPIGTVLDKLSEQYNVAIHYNKKEISGIAFTGTVLPGDSLPVILKIIGKMNRFDITQANGIFTISKQR